MSINILFYYRFCHRPNGIPVCAGRTVFSEMTKAGHNVYNRRHVYAYFLYHQKVLAKLVFIFLLLAF